MALYNRDYTAVKQFSDISLDHDVVFMKNGR